METKTVTMAVERSNGEEQGLKMDEDEIKATVTPLQRKGWASHLDFLMAALGVAVGLGNIWRFPYLCYKNGGGAFLIPYLLSLVIGAIPMYILEISIGQYTNSGSLNAWKIIPAFKGLGVAMMLVPLFSCTYYIIILAWATYYMVMSFTSVLPWSHCNNAWNTERCFVSGMEKNITNMSGIIPLNSTQWSRTNVSTIYVDSAVEFWERKALQRSSGIEEPGHVVWELAVCLVFVWLVVFFCIFKGVRLTGKVVYVTVILPYILLLVLLIRGVTLDGALDGIIFYIKPDFSRLTKAQVWIDGVTQVFFSNALASGSPITMGSYNGFHNNFYRDTIIICIVNSATSLFGGFAIFSILGFMAHEQNVSVADVAESGPGLLFIAFPKAVTKMPLSSLWSVLFFFMILLLGLDSQFVTSEGFLTPLVDMFPKTFYKTKNRMLLTAAFCTFCCLIGLSMVTQGGVYILQIFDYYAASGFVLLWICFFEAVVIGWFFGADRYYDAIEVMTGKRMSFWLKLSWKVLTPIMSGGIFLFGAISIAKPLTYDRTYIYPGWASAIGGCMAGLIIFSIPCVFLWTLVTGKGSFTQRWRTMMTPVLRPHQVHPDWPRDTYRIGRANYSLATELSEFTENGV